MLWILSYVTNIAQIFFWLLPCVKNLLLIYSFIHLTSGLALQLHGLCKYVARLEKNKARHEVVSDQNVIYHQSKRGQEQLFRGVSRGRSPRETPRKSCSCPSFDWWYNILILVRGTGIPMYFLFLPALCGKEYYSYPALQGKNNIPARRLVYGMQILIFGVKLIYNERISLSQ